MLNVLKHNFVLFFKGNKEEFISFLRKHNHKNALVNGAFYFITIKRKDNDHCQAEIIFPGSRGLIMYAKFDLSTLETEELVEVELGIAPPFRGIIMLALVVYIIGIILFLYFSTSSFNFRFACILAITIPLVFAGMLVQLRHQMHGLKYELERAIGQFPG